LPKEVNVAVLRGKYYAAKTLFYLGN